MAGVLGAVAGAALLLAPRRWLEKPARLRSLLFETNVAELFNRRYTIERHVYRRHRIYGGLVLLGALTSLALLWYLGHQPKALRSLVAALGLNGARTLALVVATVAVCLVVVGTCLVVRPSVLKGVEAALNRWIDPMPVENPHMIVSRWVLRAPRLAGALLLAAGFLCWRPF